MILFELKKQLTNKKTNPIYIFTGDELALMDIYIKQISQVSGNEISRIDRVVDVFSKLQNHSFLNKNHCYIIRDDKDMMSQDQLLTDIKNGQSIGDNILILIYSKMDKRSKFYKSNEDIITEFHPMDLEIVQQLILKEYDIGMERAGLLAALCENNYGRALLEIDKIWTLADIEGITAAEAFDLAMMDNLIYQPPMNQIFDLVDYVCKRDIENSYKGMDDFKESGESPLGLLALLYQSFRRMLLVLSAGNGDISNRTGLNQWQIKSARQLLGRYSMDELVKILRILREAERGIKTGTIDTKWVLDYIGVMIL